MVPPRKAGKKRKIAYDGSVEGDGKSYKNWVSPFTWRYRAVMAMLFLLGEGGRGASPASFRFPKIEINLDGAIVDDLSNLRVSDQTDKLQIKVGDLVFPSKDKSAVRFRYKLEGFDNGWQFRTSDMGLKVRFENDTGDFIDEKYFSSSGDSPGWTGNFSTSPLLRKKEVLEVPSNATRISLSVTSAGPPDAIGCYLAANIILSFKPQNGLASSALDKKERIVNLGSNCRWLREGTHPSMGYTIKIESSASRSDVALAIVDDDPLAHMEWRLPAIELPAISPNNDIVISWDTMFSTGLADQAIADYRPLNHVGTHLFKVQVLNAFGQVLGEKVTTIMIFTPFYLRMWFLVSIGALVSISSLFLVRNLVHRRLTRKLHALEKEHLLERERLRIARDIHDDLGARITHISLISGGALAGTQTLEEAHKVFERISQTTRGLIQALYETVWTVDPENDNADALFNHLAQLVENLCDPADIKCRIKIDEGVPFQVVPSDVRHNLTLIVKEVVNNSLKYSEALELVAEFKVSNGLLINLQDNGKGFDTAGKTGHGIENIRERCKIIGGRFEMQSHEGRGTTVTIFVPDLDYAKSC